MASKKKKRGKVSCLFPGYKADPAVLKRLHNAKQTSDGLEIITTSGKAAEDALYKARVKAAEEILPGSGSLVRRR